MPNDFQILGVEAIIAGMATFQNNANTVNRLLADINKSTSKLASDSALSWATVERTSSVAVGAIVSGAALAVTALAGITAGVVAVGASFDANVLRAAVATGATARQFDSLKETVLNVAKGSAIGITEIANAENTLARSGISVQDVQQGVLKSTVDLAEASGGELGLADAAKLVSVAMNAWHLQAGQVNDATASLTAIANSSAVGFGDLSTSIQLVAPEANFLGYSFRDVAIALGIMGNAGIKGTTAGTALKTMLVNLQQPGKAVNELMNQYNLNLFDGAGKALPYIDVINALNKAFGDEAVAAGRVTEEERAKASVVLFGTRSVLGAIAAARGGTEAYNKFNTAINETNTADLAERLRQSLNPQLAILNNNLQAFIIRASGPLVDALGQGILGFNNLLRAMDPAVPKAFGDALATIFTGKGLSATGSELQKVFGADLGDIITKIIAIIVSLRTAITTQIIPAFLILFKTLTDGTNATTNFSNFLQSVIVTIDQVGHRIANVVIALSDFVKQIRASTDTSNLLAGVLKIMVALPLVAFGLVLLRIAAGFILISGQAILLSVAIYGIGEIVRRVGATWDGTLAGMVTSIKKLPIELQALLAVVVLVSGVIIARTALQALGFINYQLIFARVVFNTIAGWVSMGVAAAVNAIKVAAAWVVMQIAAAVGSGGIVRAIGGAILSFGLLSLAAVRTALVVSGSFLVGIAGSVIAAVAAISTPILVIIGIIALLAVAVGVLYFGFRDQFNNIIGVVNGAATAIIEQVNSIANGVLAILRSVSEDVANFVEGAAQLLGQVSEAARSQMAGIVAGARAWAEHMSGLVLPAITSVASAVNPVLSSAFDWAKEAAAKFFNLVNVGSAEGDAGLRQMNLDLENMFQLLNATHHGEDALHLGPSYGYGGEKTRGRETVTPPSPSDVIGPALDTGAAKADNATEKMKALVAQFEKLLAILPGDTKALAEFLAKLETDTPGRLQPMVNALLSARGILEDINASYGRILVLNQAITQVQTHLNALQAAQNAIDLRAKLAVLGLQSQLNALTVQELHIRQQLLPIQQAIAAIDRQIADLQKVNLDYQRQSIEIQIQMLPIQQAIAAVNRQIADIDQEIAAAQREDFQNTLDTATLTAASLPIRQQIADLETQINRIHDNRLTLLRRQSEILASQRVDALTHQLGDTQRQLDTAWKNMNVPQILALEAQKNSLADSIVTATDQLTSIQDQQKAQAEAEELAQITLKLKEDTLQQILDDYDDQLTILQNIRAQEDADAAVVVAGLDIKKQALLDINEASQDQLDILQGQLDAINDLIDAENLQHQLEINGLEQQKAALEALAAPMLAQLQAIQDQQAAIQIEIDLVNALADQQKEQFDAQILNDQLELLSLQGIKDSEQERFDALVAGFIDTITASGAFTQQEAIEVATRLGFGNDQINKIGEIARAYDTTLVAAVKVATKAIDDIPREITVHVRVVTDNVPSFEYGGTVQGPKGSPQLIIAHGGEEFLGHDSTLGSYTQIIAKATRKMESGLNAIQPISNNCPANLPDATVLNAVHPIVNFPVGELIPLFIQALEQARWLSATNASKTTTNHYEVHANYSQVQSQANLGLDLRAIIAMSRK